MAEHVANETSSETIHLQYGLDKLRGKVLVLKADVSGLKDDVSVLKDDVGELKRDIAELKKMINTVLGM